MTKTERAPQSKIDKRTQGFPEEENSIDKIRERRKRNVALGYRLLASQRWGDAGDGHISARDPKRTDCFWLLRHAVSFHEARVRDLVLVGPDGELVEGKGVINPAAYYIHAPILNARPEAVSAVHVHTGWGTPFAAEVRRIEPITQESCIFFEDHAIFDGDEVQIQDVEGGKKIATALGENRAIILRNHGLLTVADRVDEAVGSFVLMERVAEAHMKVKNARPISAEAARYAKTDLTRNGAGRCAFAWLVARYIADPSVVD